jgi:DNA-binding NarL/FixJ family response regulator
MMGIVTILLIIWLEEGKLVTITQAPPEIGEHAVDSLLSILKINGGVVIRPRQAETTPVDAQPLTDREIEVLSLVAEGYSNKMVAARLGISERTVKNHLTYIMIKLRASDRTHAVVTAVRLGWLEI